MPGSISAQTVQLLWQWLCGTVVIPNSMDNLSFDVKSICKEKEPDVLVMYSLGLKYYY